MNLFLKIGSKLSYIWNRRSGNAYIDYLRKKAFVSEEIAYQEDH